MLVTVEVGYVGARLVNRRRSIGELVGKVLEVNDLPLDCPTGLFHGRQGFPVESG